MSFRLERTFTPRHSERNEVESRNLWHLKSLKLFGGDFSIPLRFSRNDDGTSSK